MRFYPRKILEESVASVVIIFKRWEPEVFFSVRIQWFEICGPINPTIKQKILQKTSQTAVGILKIASKEWHTIEVKIEKSNNWHPNLPWPHPP